MALLRVPIEHRMQSGGNVDAAVIELAIHSYVVALNHSVGEDIGRGAHGICAPQPRLRRLSLGEVEPVVT